MNRIGGLTRAEHLALAKTGIEALVDEATGFQKVRAKDELETRLKEHLAEAGEPRSVLPERIKRTAAILKKRGIVPGVPSDSPRDE